MGGFFDWLDKTWDTVSQAYKDNAVGRDMMLPAIWEIAAGVGGADGDRIGRGFKFFFDSTNQMTTAGGKALSAVLQPDQENYVPGLHETQWTASKLLWLYDRAMTYGIRRPVTTFLRVGSETDFGEDPFAAETWRRAWNDSERITPGQQAMFNLAFNFVDDPEKYDPGTPEGRKHYYDDPLFQGVSGSLDFGLMFVDPFKVSGGLGKATLRGAAGAGSKAAESAVMKAGIAPSTKMLEQGFREREAFGKGAQAGDDLLTSGGTLSDRYQKVYDLARTKDLPDFQRLLFNNSAFGGVVASTTWTLARNGDEALFADAMLASRGNYDAMTRLQAKAPDVAIAFARTRQGMNIPQAVRQYANNPMAQGVVDAQMQLQFNAWVSDFAKDLKGQAGFWENFQGSTANQGRISASILDKMRVGLHQKSTAFAPTVIGKWGRGALRTVNPQARYAPFVDVNSSASFRSFRYNVERSGLDADRRNGLVAQYMSAATPQERSAVIAEADDLITRDTLQRHGFTPEEFDQYQGELSKLRQVVSSAMQRSTMHVPSAILAEANKALAAGRLADANRLKAVATEYDRLVQAGQVPEVMQLLPDNRANLNLVADFDRLRADTPLFESTTANLMPMLDYRELEVGIRRSLAPMRRLEQRAAGMQIGGSNLADIVNMKSYAATTRLKVAAEVLQTVWSIAAVLRPAQVVRSGADDLMRAVTYHGMLPYLTSGATGAGRLAYKLAHGAMGKAKLTRAQAWTAARVERLTGGRVGARPIDVDSIDFDLPTDLADMQTWQVQEGVGLVPPRARGGFYQIAPMNADLPKVRRDANGALVDVDFPSLESAVAAGVLPGSLYVDYVLEAVAHGRATPDLVALVDQYQNGFLTLQQFQHQTFERLLDNAGISAFTNPQWQQDFYDAATKARNGVVVDPLGGAVVDAPLNVFDGFDAGPTALVKVDPQTGFYNIDDVYEFLTGHAEAVVAKNLKVHAVRHGQDLKVTLVRPRSARRSIAERLTRTQRDQLRKGLRTIGQDHLSFRDPNGNEIRVAGVFAGMEGDWTRTNIGSRTVMNSAWANTVSIKNASRQIMKGGQLKNFRPGERGYEAAWEYYANSVVANDPVARMTMEGRTYAEILDWLSTKQGRAWVAARPYKSADLPGQVTAIMDATERLVPAIPELRTKVLRHEATTADMVQAMPDEALRPEVLGQSDAFAFGNHPLLEWSSRKIDNMFRVMQDMPLDRLIRYPFARAEYESVALPMVKNYVNWAGKNGKPIMAEEIDRIQGLARQHTLDTVGQVLYDTASRTDAAHALRLFMPFSGAIADAVFKWARLAWKRPVSTAGNWYRFYYAPDRAGLVYDQDGYHLSFDKNGNEVWTSPLTGQRAPDGVEHEKYVLMRFPELGGKQVLPKDGQFIRAFNKDSMNTILSVPTAGPLVAIPANSFALKYPKLADNPIVKNFVLPFGPTEDGAARQAMPGLLGSFNRWFGENQDLASSSAMEIYATWLAEAAHGDRPYPTVEEAKAQAESEMGLRFLTSAFSPVSQQYYSPYKPFTDYYRQLVTKYEGDQDAAMHEFRKTVGDQFLYMTYHVSKSNVSVPSSRTGYDRFKANEALVRKFPELAGLITGGDGAGSWNKVYYEWQKTISINGKPMREVMSMGESVDELEKRVTWSEYTKMMDLIDVEMEERGVSNIAQARDLAAAKAAWIEARKPGREPGTVSAWYRDYMASDSSAVDARLSAMRDILGDTKLVQSRQDLQGLAEYISERDRFRHIMERNGYATLTSQKSAWLAKEWDDYVNGLKGRNLAFSQLYNRWLTRDDLSDPGVVEGQFSFGEGEEYGSY